MLPESRCCELADVRARLKQEEEERLALQAEERRRQEEAWHRHQQDRERRQGRQSQFPYPVRIWIPPPPQTRPDNFFFKRKICHFFRIPTCEDQIQVLQPQMDPAVFEIFRVDPMLDFLLLVTQIQGRLSISNSIPGIL